MYVHYCCLAPVYTHLFVSLVFMVCAHTELFTLDVDSQKLQVFCFSASCFVLGGTLFAEKADRHKSAFSLHFSLTHHHFAILFAEKPDAPSKPEAIDITKEYITLKWLPPDNDGGNAIFNYAVEMRVCGSSRWLPASQNIKVPETSFTVRELVEGTNYEFRVSAENKAGVGPPSPSSGPVTAKEPISELNHSCSVREVGIGGS